MHKIESALPIYFASDQHFGAPDKQSSRDRELRFVSWLENLKGKTEALFLLGDLFDFWYEYKEVVPRGFTRVLGTLARLKDSGIQIYFFTGNHDLWMGDYFETELGIPVFHHPQVFELHGKKCLIGHGDGLGPGDKGYKRMKRLFTSPLAQWCFSRLHPNFAVRLGRTTSLNNKLISGSEDITFKGRENEWLIAYCEKKLQETHFDYFLFGHRHYPMRVHLPNNSFYFNTGDWIQYDSFAVMEKGTINLQSLKPEISFPEIV